MDTRAFSMARSLRLSAGVGALVLSVTCGSAIAQNRGDDQISIPFSSLSVSAQQEILALQRIQNRESDVIAPAFPVDQPVARQSVVPVPSQTVMLDGRKLRINWAIGMYR
jgi:hypothetical protein